MKTRFSIVLLFSRNSPFVCERLVNFRSLFVHFLWFFVKTTINRKFPTQNCDFFVILNTSLPFWCKILSGGGEGDNFQFSINFGQFS